MGRGKKNHSESALIQEAHLLGMLFVLLGAFCTLSFDQLVHLPLSAGNQTGKGCRNVSARSSFGVTGNYVRGALSVAFILAEAGSGSWWEIRGIVQPFRKRNLGESHLKYIKHHPTPGGCPVIDRPRPQLIGSSLSKADV